MLFLIMIQILVLDGKRFVKFFKIKRNLSFSILLNFYMFYFVFTFYIFNKQIFKEF